MQSPGRLAAHEMQNATSQLRLYGVDGTLQTSVELQGLGTLTGVGGEWDGDRIAVGFTSFAVPPMAYVVDPATGSAEILAQGGSGWIRRVPL